MGSTKIDVGAARALRGVSLTAPARVHRIDGRGLIMRMILAAALAIAPLLAKDNEGVKRLNEATSVFSEVMATPDKGIPQEMLENAHCIVIVPSLKTAAFLV